MAGAGGRKVVLTREAEDNRELAARLRARGVAVLEVPCLETELVWPEEIPSGPFQAVVFTSRRAVRGVFEQGLEHLVRPSEGRPLLAAVGPATAAALRNFGVEAELVSEKSEGEFLGRKLRERLGQQSRLLLPGGDLSAGDLEKILEQAGHRVVRLQVYRNREPQIPSLDPFPALVFVASPSAAVRLLEKNPWLVGQSFFTIGSTTGRALSARGVDRVMQMGDKPSDWEEILFHAYHEEENP